MIEVASNDKGRMVLVHLRNHLLNITGMAMTRSDLLFTIVLTAGVGGVMLLSAAVIYLAIRSPYS